MPRSRLAPPQRGRTAISNGDISIDVGFAVSAAAYYALMRGRIGIPAPATTDPAYAHSPQPHPSIRAAATSESEETF